jgi:hypothetical protein
MSTIDLLVLDKLLLIFQTLFTFFTKLHLQYSLMRRSTIISHPFLLVLCVLNSWEGNPNRKGRVSAVDLFVLISIDELLSVGPFSLTHLISEFDFAV